MKFWTILNFAILAGCVSVTERTQTVRSVPTLEDVSSMESGFLLLKNIETVGVIDSKSLNVASRVRVRSLRCTLSSASEVVCSYESNRCLDNEADLNGDAWCQRSSLFGRFTGGAPTPTSNGGWILKRPL